jgi:phospholipid/cholesterol/gamma-HCH transport system permease protein
VVLRESKLEVGGWKIIDRGDNSVIALSGNWVARVMGADGGVAQRVLVKKPRTIKFESQTLGHWDSALIAFLSDLRNAAAINGVTFDQSGLPPDARRLLTLVSPEAAKASPVARAPFVERVGIFTISACAELKETAALVGRIVLRGGFAVTGQAATRASDVFDCMYDAGPAALIIVAIVNFLVGGILAFIAAIVLRKFGAELYAASIVSIGMVREMAAIMTAIIMAGRTGGAYAANIAAMRGNEEIDALQSFGIPVFDYLIFPRILALTGMMPVLYAFGCAVGILGGLLVATVTLGATATSFFIETQNSLSGSEFALGFMKSVAFGILIAIVSCRVGLRAGRSASEVGKAATSAVVASIVGVIALDAVFDLCANVLDI